MRNILIIIGITFCLTVQGQLSTLDVPRVDICNDTATFWFSAEQHAIELWFLEPYILRYFKGQIYTECISDNFTKPNWDDAIRLGEGTFRDVIINGVQQCESTPSRDKQ